MEDERRQAALVTAAVGPWRRSADEKPSAQIAEVSFSLSAASSADRVAEPARDADGGLVLDERRCAARLGQLAGAAQLDGLGHQAGHRRETVAQRRLAPSARASAANAASCAVNVLVAATERSSPAA